MVWREWIGQDSRAVCAAMEYGILNSRARVSIGCATLKPSTIYNSAVRIVLQRIHRPNIIILFMHMSGVANIGLWGLLGARDMLIFKS